MKQIFFIILLTLISNNLLFGQKKDPVLFEVDNVPVHVSEFKYIYEKTNGKKADYSEQSVQEYLELYKKFKLKVKKAKDMKLDTISSLKTELEGYRKQLANSYLIDKEVTDRLIKEAHDRSKKDLQISHIMVGLGKNPSPADTLAAYTKIMGAKTRLDKGEDFAKVAKEVSTDKTAIENGGQIGYITAMLPNGFYAMETAAYTTKKGHYSAPVRTAAGYHIIKVDNIREARGQMEVAHILIRKPKDNSKPNTAKSRMDSIYQALEKGASFEEMAKLSQDKSSVDKGGRIGVFGINRYESSFEDAAFGLKKDGNYTVPIETTVGWHIIQRVERKPLLSYKASRARLQGKVKRDGRYEIAKKAMIEAIKKENNFVASEKALNRYIKSLDKSFLTYKWKAEKADIKKVLFTIGNENISQIDLGEYMEKASRDRMRMGRGGDIESTVKSLYETFVNERVLAYEERLLEQKYPEFKSLMREYEEGILLFEATKMLVWDKASQDTVGLKAYFEKLKGRGKYLWKERAKVSFYSLKKGNEKELDKVRKMAAEKSVAKVLEKFNKKKEVLTARYETIEKGKNKVLDALDWNVGTLSATEIDGRNKSSNFLKIEEVMPPKPKDMSEARGYIIADYQDYLEKNWIQELQRDYKIKVNKKALKRLMKENK